VIDAALRQRVAEAAAAVRNLLDGARLPPPLLGERAQQRCKGCSLRERCQPEAAHSAALLQARAQLFDPDAPL